VIVGLVTFNLIEPFNYDFHQAELSTGWLLTLSFKLALLQLFFTDAQWLIQHQTDFSVNPSV